MAAVKFAQQVTTQQAAPRQNLPIEAIAILAEGKGAERKYAAVKLTLEGDRIAAVSILERSAHRDLAQDAARRALWKLKIAADPDVLVHERPRNTEGAGPMPCCGKAFDARSDRMSDQADRVTCKGPRP